MRGINRNKTFAANGKELFSILELFIVILLVYYDFLLPAVLISLLGFLFIIIRRDKLPIRGFGKDAEVFRIIVSIFGFVLLWQAVDFGILMPVLNHLSGTKQDLSTFEDLKGNPAMLFLLLTAGWTIAALMEELAFRGFLQNRVESLFTDTKLGIIAAVSISSVLFGFIHMEQGIVGILITTIDALFFSYVKYRYHSLWASVLAHGFMNTIGIITFYFTGPIYGLW